MTHVRLTGWIEATDETAQTLRDEKGHEFPAAGLWVIRNTKDWRYGWYEIKKP